jgi:hypothetical protein
MNRIIQKLSIEDKIRTYFLKKYNVKISDADMPEVRQSMFYLGSAIARYVVLQEEKRDTKPFGDRSE